MDTWGLLFGIFIIMMPIVGLASVFLLIYFARKMFPKSEVKKMKTNVFIIAGALIVVASIILFSIYIL